MFDYNRFGAGIKYYRKRRRLSIEALAEVVNISTKHLSKIEHGSAKPSTILMTALCNTLDVRPQDCINFQDDIDNVLYHQFKARIKSFSTSQKQLFLNVIKSVEKL